MVHDGDNLDIFKLQFHLSRFFGKFSAKGVSPKLPLQALQGTECKALKFLNVTHT